MLTIFGGLPGVGKTTLPKAVAGEWEAVYLRVDTIEQALRFSKAVPGEVGPAGYWWAIGWLKNGAQPTESVASLLKRSGIAERFEQSKSTSKTRAEE